MLNSLLLLLLVDRDRIGNSFLLEFDDSLRQRRRRKRKWKKVDSDRKLLLIPFPFHFDLDFEEKIHHSILLLRQVVYSELVEPTSLELELIEPLSFLLLLLLRRYYSLVVVEPVVVVEELVVEPVVVEPITIVDAPKLPPSVPDPDLLLRVLLVVDLIHDDDLLLLLISLRRHQKEDLVVRVIRVRSGITNGGIDVSRVLLDRRKRRRIFFDDR